MAAFCYKNEEGDVFGIAMVEDLPEKDINSILDLVSVPSKEHISVDEFEETVRGKYIVVYPILNRDKNIIANIATLDGVDVRKGIVEEGTAIINL